VKYEVTLRTDNKVQFMGKGRVNILTKKGEKKYILDVYFSPWFEAQLDKHWTTHAKGLQFF